MLRNGRKRLRLFLPCSVLGVFGTDRLFVCPFSKTYHFSSSKYSMTVYMVWRTCNLTEKDNNLL